VDGSIQRCGAGDYDEDLVIADAVLVELKIVPQYDKLDEAQVVNEVNACGIRLGTLINFGRSKVEFKRLVF